MDRDQCAHCLALVEGKDKELICDEAGVPIENVRECREWEEWEKWERGE